MNWLVGKLRTTSNRLGSSDREIGAGMRCNWPAHITLKAPDNINAGRLANPRGSGREDYAAREIVRLGANLDSVMWNSSA